MEERVVITIDGDDDSNGAPDMHVSTRPLVRDEDGIVLEPHLGMEFESEEAGKTFYDGYAQREGFSIRVSHLNRENPDPTVKFQEFLCSIDGSREGSGRGCEAMLRIDLRDANKWIVTKFVKEHSHAIIIPDKVQYPKTRNHSTPVNRVKETPGRVVFVSVDGNHVPAKLNVGRNMPVAEANHAVRNVSSFGCASRNSSRKRTLGRDAQNLLDHFNKMQAENPGFYYAIQLDEDNRLANAFWADARSRTSYSHFGDAVFLDTSYIRNQYTVPVVPFAGVNHHGQTILFGCALLQDESEGTFVWLFKTFMASMGDRDPVSLTTDNDIAISAAVKQVFPGVRHCVNKWHVLSEGRDRMAGVCIAHPNIQVDLFNCINMSETIEEFESHWASILEKYNLRRNVWLNLIYDSRNQWVPVYFRDTFFAAVFSSRAYESSFFDGFVNQQTTLPMFFRQYERALESSFEKEIEADFDTICTTPVLKTPSPMEKQAADLYTKRVFSKFQEELVETFVYTANRIEGNGHSITFRVAKYEDDRKSYIVSLNLAEKKANCSCQMFEYCGILCRHVLTVFTVTNVLTLPSDYILKRWTRNAKGLAADECRELRGHESLTARFNTLCREGLRFAEDGALTSETYRAALVSLREGTKKVANVKKVVAKVAPSSSQVNEVRYNGQETLWGPQETAPLRWPRHDEMAQCFNPNNFDSQSVPDKSVTRISTDHLNGESCHADNMVVLPCLKSMTWVMEKKNSTEANQVAMISLKLHDYSKTPSRESEIKFSLTRLTLEPMLRSMSYISEQLSTPANKVAVINLKLQDTEIASGESEVKFQVSKDTLGAMLRSMAYIRKQLSNTVEPEESSPSKRSRK